MRCGEQGSLRLVRSLISRLPWATYGIQGNQPRLHNKNLSQKGGRGVKEKAKKGNALRGDRGCSSVAWIQSPGLHPQHSIKLGIVSYTSNPSTWKAELEASEVQGYPPLPCLKEKERKQVCWGAECTPVILASRGWGRTTAMSSWLVWATVNSGLVWFTQQDLVLRTTTQKRGWCTGSEGQSICYPSSDYLGPTPQKPWRNQAWWCTSPFPTFL